MTNLVRAGAAMTDVTPPAGLAMAGFAARTKAATGAHDPLTIRAIAIDDTAIVSADVIGLHEVSCRRIRERASLEADRIVVAALHNHGGPVCMPGRVGASLDENYLARLEDACVQAIDRAVAAQRPARLLFGLGADPGVARNRRHEGGITDPHLPLLRVQALDGAGIGVLTAYACHPVVLGADNLLWTADYPYFVRRKLEEAHPGATALFLTGCCGDANSGHSAHASISLAANANRTFVAAERIGERIAECAIATEAESLSGAISAASRTVMLDFARRETEPPQALAAQWRAELETADAACAALLRSWVGWAETVAPKTPEPWPARVTVLNWGGVNIIALPGEIFAETAHAIRGRLDDPRAIVVGFCEGCPGYIPPASEFPFGGYEIDEAHRYYGSPATFAPGAAEALIEAAISIAR